MSDLLNRPKGLDNEEWTMFQNWINREDNIEPAFCFDTASQKYNNIRRIEYVNRWDKRKGFQDDEDETDLSENLWEKGNGGITSLHWAHTIINTFNDIAGNREIDYCVNRMLPSSTANKMIKPIKDLGSGYYLWRFGVILNNLRDSRVDALRSKVVWEDTKIPNGLSEDEVENIMYTTKIKFWQAYTLTEDDYLIALDGTYNRGKTNFASALKELKEMIEFGKNVQHELLHLHHLVKYIESP